jgi:hypothetical protein
MTWTRFPNGLRLNPLAQGSPEALVVLLHDVGASAASLTPIAARWAATVPTTAFIALDGITRSGLSLQASVDREARALEPVIQHQLLSSRLDVSRLVLVGFGYGGTLALHMFLRQDWSRAGVLTFSAKLMRPLPRILSVSHKVRLVEDERHRHNGHGSLRDVVGLLSARGIDARGVLLASSTLSDEAIRHGGAYLVELVASAQGGDQFHVGRQSSHAPRRRLS